MLFLFDPDSDEPLLGLYSIDCDTPADSSHRCVWQMAMMELMDAADIGPHSISESNGGMSVAARVLSIIHYQSENRSSRTLQRQTLSVATM